MKPDFSDPIRTLRLQAERLANNARSDDRAGEKDDAKTARRRSRNYALAAQFLETEQEKQSDKGQKP
jgi:hypothetical protein